VGTTHTPQNTLETVNSSKFLLGGISTPYTEYTQETLEFLLNYLWNAETSHFLKEVGRDGTATVRTEYITFEQAICFNTLAYAYPQVENQTLRALILDRLTSAADALIRDFWAEDGAVLSAYPQINNPQAEVKYALYQAIVTSALIAAHKVSGTDIYLSQAKRTTNFMLQQLWDDIDRGFYFADFNGTIDTYKDAQSQAIVISALISAFDQFGTEIYLERAQQTAEFALTHLWDRNNTGFYIYSTANGTVPIDGRLKRTVTQALMIRALSELYHKINDNQYLDYINRTISFSLSHLWDPNNGGFFAHTSEDGLIVDETMSKAASKQFYMILALLEAYNIYRGLIQSFEVPKALEYANYIFRIILETLEFVIKQFWDVEYKGFYIAHDMMGEIQNTNKFAIPQALGVEIFLKTLNTRSPIVTNPQWDPITPTPIDRITISVSAFGLSPIETVILKYNLNDNIPAQSILMEPTQAVFTYEAEIGPFLNGSLVIIVVWANNSMGEEFSRKYDEILVTEDRKGPAIHISEVEPPTPQALELVEITVHVVDDRPHIDVGNVTISYHIDEGKWETLALSQIDGNLFNISIGPFPGDSTVEFYFTAYDSFGNSGITEVMTFEIQPEKRTIGSFEGIIAIIALVSLLCGRYFVSSRQNPRTKKQRI